MIWLLAYVAAMFLIALPVALARRKVVAAVIFAVWSVGQLAYAAGFPEPTTQAFIYGAAFGYCLVVIFLHPYRWSERCIGSSIMFLPLAAVCWHWSTTPCLDPWWTIYWLAWGQLLLAVRPRTLLAAYRELWRQKRVPPNVLRMTVA